MSDREKMGVIMPRVYEILNVIRPEKKWTIEMVEFSAETRRIFTEWDLERFHFLNGEEYLCFWDAEGYLLYAVNVTGDAVGTTLEELFKIIAVKF